MRKQVNNSLIFYVLWKVSKYLNIVLDVSITEKI